MSYVEKKPFHPKSKYLLIFFSSFLFLVGREETLRKDKRTK